MTKFEEEFDEKIMPHKDNLDLMKVRKHFKDWQPQQALPVVPECVAEWIEFCKNGKNIFSFLNQDSFYHSGKAKELCEKVRRWSQMSEEKLTLMARAWLDGYTVEKPQLFKLIFPKSTTVLEKNGELNTFSDTFYQKYLIKNAMTEQEIKSIDERYWQFAVPVGDGE